MNPIAEALLMAGWSLEERHVDGMFHLQLYFEGKEHAHVRHRDYDQAYISIASEFFEQYGKQIFQEQIS